MNEPKYLVKYRDMIYAYHDKESMIADTEGLPFVYFVRTDNNFVSYIQTTLDKIKGIE